MKYYNNDTFENNLNKFKELNKKIRTQNWVLTAIEKDIKTLSPKSPSSTRKSPEYNSLLQRRTILCSDIQQTVQQIWGHSFPSTNKESALVSFVTKVA